MDRSIVAAAPSSGLPGPAQVHSSAPEPFLETTPAADRRAPASRLRPSSAQRVLGKVDLSNSSTSLGEIYLSRDRVTYIPPLLSVSDAREHLPVMTLQQAADYLQISKAHLSNVINRKLSDVQPLRCCRVGRRILIKRAWIDEWLENADKGSIRSW